MSEIAKLLFRSTKGMMLDINVRVGDKRPPEIHILEADLRHFDPHYVSPPIVDWSKTEDPAKYPDPTIKVLRFDRTYLYGVYLYLCATEGYQIFRWQVQHKHSITGSHYQIDMKGLF